MRFRQRPGFVTLDGPKLYAALLAVKQTINISWVQLAVEAGVSRGPIGHLRDGGTIEATSYLRLVRWLDETSVAPFTRIEGEPPCTFREPSDGSDCPPSSSSSSGPCVVSS